MNFIKNLFRKKAVCKPLQELDKKIREINPSEAFFVEEYKFVIGFYGGTWIQKIKPNTLEGIQLKHVENPETVNFLVDYYDIIILTAKIAKKEEDEEKFLRNKELISALERLQKKVCKEVKE